MKVTFPPRIHVLSLWRPWCATFFQPGLAYPKRVENRSKVPPRNVIGTWVCFHAGQKFDHARMPLIRANTPEVSAYHGDHPTGLIGIAYIAGFTMHIDNVHDDQRRWWLGPVAYLVPHVLAFDEPIPCKGQQGWKFLSDEHAAKVRQWEGTEV